jgi:hypothetical protein
MCPCSRRVQERPAEPSVQEPEVGRSLSVIYEPKRTNGQSHEHSGRECTIAVRMSEDWRNSRGELYRLTTQSHLPFPNDAALSGLPEMIAAIPRSRCDSIDFQSLRGSSIWAATESAAWTALISGSRSSEAKCPQGTLPRSSIATASGGPESRFSTFRGMVRDGQQLTQLTARSLSIGLGILTSHAVLRYLVILYLQTPQTLKQHSHQSRVHAFVRLRMIHRSGIRKSPPPQLTSRPPDQVAERLMRICAVRVSRVIAERFVARFRNRSVNHEVLPNFSFFF